MGPFFFALCCLGAKAIFIVLLMPPAILEK